MNRENKRKQYEKGYYKTHPCDESFTCRNLQLFGNLRHPLNGKGRAADGLHGDGHELDGIIVRRDPIGAERAAPAAAVDDRPFAVFPNPHRHRLHQSAAVRFPVARLNVQMYGTQAVGAMVPVVAPRARRDDGIV